MNTILLIIGVSLYCLIFYLLGRTDEKIRQSKIERAGMQEEVREMNLRYCVIKTGNFFIIEGKRYRITREGLMAYKREDWEYFKNLIKEA